MIKYLEKIDFKILNSDYLKYIAIAGGSLKLLFKKNFKICKRK